MFPLTPVFMRRSAPLSSAQTTGNDSATEADAGGALTLEMRDNPFASLMHKINRLIDTDPAAALLLANVALTDKTFEGKQELTLRAKADQLIDLVHKEEEKPDASGTFAKSVLHILPPQPLRPAAAPALTLTLPR